MKFSTREYKVIQLNDEMDNQWVLEKWKEMAGPYRLYGSELITFTEKVVHRFEKIQDMMSRWCDRYRDQGAQLIQEVTGKLERRNGVDEEDGGITTVLGLYDMEEEPIKGLSVSTKPKSSPGVSHQGERDTEALPPQTATDVTSQQPASRPARRIGVRQ